MQGVLDKVEFLVIHRYGDRVTANKVSGGTPAGDPLDEALDLAEQTFRTEWVTLVRGPSEYLITIEYAAMTWDPHPGVLRRIRLALIALTLSPGTTASLLAELGMAANLVDKGRVDLVFVLQEPDLHGALKRTLEPVKSRPRGRFLAVRYRTATSLRTE